MYPFYLFDNENTRIDRIGVTGLQSSVHLGYGTYSLPIALILHTFQTAWALSVETELRSSWLIVVNIQLIKNPRVTIYGFRCTFENFIIKPGEGIIILDSMTYDF